MSSTTWNADAVLLLFSRQIATIAEHRRRDAREHVDAHRRPELLVEDAEEREERAVVRRDGLDAVGADHPDRTRRDERADEAERHHDEQRMRGAAVDAVERQRDRVDEAADPCHLARRQHEQDAEDRNRRTSGRP